MACYAAVLSLFHTLNNIKIHPRPPISLDQNQVESLTQILSFFQHFLESYPNSDTKEDDELERRIKAAAYAAEDLIEIHIVDQIHAQSNITTVDLSRDLDVVIQDMDLIRKEVIQVKKHKDIAAQLPTNSSFSEEPASTWQSRSTPVFDEAMTTQVLDKLTGQQSSLQIIPIVGMGGIGKTTFATSLYTKSLIVEHFDIRAWVTISQEYSIINMLDVLCQEVKVSTSALSEDEIGLKLYQHLYSRRYLIVVDDIWSVEAWDKVRCYFPENNNGSRIMITTRLSNMAFQLSGCHVFQMQFLVEDKSWDLLSEIVFGKLGCPIELEYIGKEIAKQCGGLPLSIVVVGGLLRKSNMTQAYWIYTLENLRLIINLENDEYALRILRTSYKELPMHLKPCFLYMGIFPEDKEIKMSVLIKLWVAEGILRPIDDKSLEEVGKVYLKELIDRNLILISELPWDGEVKLCKIHDLLRDICLREAQKQKFFCLLRQQKDADMECRIFINPESKNYDFSPQFLQAVETASLTRSLLYRLCRFQWMVNASPSLRFRLLRVYSSFDNNYWSSKDSYNAIFKQANMRYLSLFFSYRDAAAAPRLLSLFSLLWNLQTLEASLANSGDHIIASKIWEMPLLRHVMFYKFVLPDPPNGEHNYVLENLQTLKHVMNLKFSEEVVKRIPNVKKLKVEYDEGLPNLCLNNLGRLQNLESLNLYVFDVLEKIRSNWVSFPRSLKKLSLSGTKLSWEELTIMIGSLPLLQFLKLDWAACVGPRWETIEGQFCSLTVLHIRQCYDLKYLDTDSPHFPRLEILRLQHLINLKEIPSSVGDIPTLKLIQLSYCSTSASDSAKVIKEEQEENGNEDLQVEIEYRVEEDLRGKEDEEYCSHEEDEQDSSEDQVVSYEQVGHGTVERSWQRRNSFP